MCQLVVLYSARKLLLKSDHQDPVLAVNDRLCDRSNTENIAGYALVEW